MTLFKENICGHKDWAEVYQSIPAFYDLIRFIADKEGLPFVEPENLTPGTNAVFRLGGYVVKIFAPDESGMNQTQDYETELFATKRAFNLGVSVPRIAGSGVVEDRYSFRYLIMDFIEAVPFDRLELTQSGKAEFAGKLRDITDRLNTPCEEFNGIDVFADTYSNRRWDSYTPAFREGKEEYISAFSYGEKLFVHGDLCGDNILTDGRGRINIIDFADSVLAPQVYEHALIAAELFDFDRGLISGFFGGLSVDEITEICLGGLLIHDFGGDVISQHLGNPKEFHTIHELRNRIRGRLSG